MLRSCWHLRVLTFLIQDAPNVNKTPNLYYWYVNLACFNVDAIKRWSNVHEQEAKDEDIDLFGEIDEDEAQKLKEKNKLEHGKPKAKPKVIAKSIVVFDVKVYEEDQDLESLAAKIKKIELDGLVWMKEHKIIVVAYTIKKIQMTCIIEDEKVSCDDFIEIIQAWEDEVQNVDIVLFQKN